MTSRALSAITLAITSLLPAATTAAPAAIGGTLFEDATKHVAFVPPPNFLFDPKSTREKLVFLGPKSGAGAAKLTIQAERSGRPLADEVAHHVREVLALPSGVTPTAIEANAPFLGAVASFPQKVDGKELQRLVAAGRNGPEVVFFTFELPAASFEASRADLLACIANAQPLQLVAVFADPDLGVSFFHLPKDWDVDTEKRKPGKQVGWLLRRGETTYSDLTVEVVCDALPPDALAKKLTSERVSLTRMVNATDVRDLPFALSGQVGVLYEVNLLFKEHDLKNRHWYAYVQNSAHLLRFHCSAETQTFERELQPVFEEFLRSTALDLGSAAAAKPGS